MFDFKRAIIRVLAVLLLLLPVQVVRASAYDASPKLIVVVIIDQFRGDYLDRYKADFKGEGFRLFLDHGAYFEDCYYDYANTKTAPGHATLGTGAYTDGHGIASNSWWDLSRNNKRPISSVEDGRYHLVGMPNADQTSAGASPLNLRASTLGDSLRLATQGESKVFGVSLKDRAAILSTGYSANGAFWIDPASGAFITSSYYMQELPEWATAFDTGPRIAQARADAGAPSGNFHDTVGGTPAANAYELDFSRALITGEQLGQHPVTDMLVISLSANDIAGHRTGPDSPEEREMVDTLDQQLDSFFTWLDKNVPGGLPSVWITLAADHGVAPTPVEASKLGLPAATFQMDKLTASLNDSINAKFSPGEKIPYLLPDQDLPYLALNRPAFERAGINEQEAEQAVQDAVPAAVTALTVSQQKLATELPPPASPAPAQPATASGVTTSPPFRLPSAPIVVHTYTREQLASGQLPPSEWGKLLAHSYSPNGGWYVMVIPGAYQMAGVKLGTTHFSPWSYDRHIPLAFYGTPFITGIYHGRVQPVDMAATLASLLGVNQPSASVGHILSQAIRNVPPSARGTAGRTPRSRREARKPAASAPAKKTGAGRQ